MKSVLVRLSEEQVKSLDVLAKEAKASRSEILRRAIDCYIKNSNTGAAPSESVLLKAIAKLQATLESTLVVNTTEATTETEDQLPY